MPFKIQAYKEIHQYLKGRAQIVAVSKVRTVKEIMEAYKAGVRDFGENYVQELVSKQSQLPGDIRWHFIGHLQRNKVRYISPFVHLVHGVDSIRLLEEINKQGIKLQKNINVLLQVHIASEETKFGFDAGELDSIDTVVYEGIKICGLMGMASFSDDEQLVRKEFRSLNELYKKYKPMFKEPSILSMGMSSDYRVAVEEGSNMVRIGSALFGFR